MQVIGLTSSLRTEADRKFQGGFRAWLAEIRHGAWRSWPEILKHYPDACRMGEYDAHFPLADDGGGIEASLMFPSDSARLSIIRLLRVRPAPAMAVRVTGRKISKPLAS